MAFENNMGDNSNSKHVNMDANSKLIPRTISDILKDVLMVSEGSKKPSDLDSQIESYENELRKVAAFKRELPLCMQLLKDGIEKLNEERLQWEWENREPEPIVTLPINTDQEDELEKMSNIDDFDHNAKRIWVSTFQLWTTSVEYDPHPLPKFTGKRGEFNPYKKKPVTSIVDCDDAGEAEEINRGVIRPQPQLIQKKKQRRCWSPDLHDLFVDALDKLGGAEVSTPKRILEKMQVEGLTSDEVKSHLQKYRIHIRRTTSSAGLANNCDIYVQEKEVGEPDCKGKRAYHRF